MDTVTTFDSVGQPGPGPGPSPLGSYGGVSGGSGGQQAPRSASQTGGPDGSVTRALAGRLSNLSTSTGWPLLGQWSRALVKCADAGDWRREPEEKDKVSWRCQLRVCPRCSTRQAKRHRKQAEDRLQTAETLLELGGHAREFFLLTATVGANDPSVGLCTLARAWTELLHRPEWRGAVAGGVRCWDAAPARQALGPWWSIHAHCYLELLPGAKLTEKQLGSVWRDLLGGESLKLQAGGVRWKQGPRRFSPPLFYVTRQVRSSLLDLTDAELVAWIQVMAGVDGRGVKSRRAPRLVAWLGAWRATPDVRRAQYIEKTASAAQGEAQRGPSAAREEVSP